MEPGVPLDEVQGADRHEFFERARARLTLEVPPALTDLDRDRRCAATSISSRSCGRRPASRRPGRPPCWCRWSSAPSRWCC